MKKRVLSLFLAITLCLTLTPTGALAAEEQPPEQMVTATQEAETGSDENAPPANLEENPTENAPAAAEKNTADEENGKETGQNEPTAEGKNEPLALGLDDPGQNAAEGENGEGSGGTHYVAESGGTQYETVQDILDNMEEEITLLDSVTENLTVCAATTINMNGHSITGNIDATASLTLNGGTVDGTVKVDGGTFTMTAPAEAEAAITGELNVVSGSAFVSGAQVGVKGTLYFDGTDMLISGAVKAVELDSAAEPAAKTLYGSATVNGDTAAEAGFDTDTYKVGDEIAKKLTNKQVGSTTPAAPSLTLTETSKSLTAGKTAVFTANYTGTDTLNAYVQGSAVNGYFTISQKNNGGGTYTVSVKIDEETPGGTYTLFVHELGNTSVQASATITVTGLPDAAEVNGKQYKSLPRALDAAQDGDTVKLLANHTTNWSDVEAGEYATLAVVRKTLTLDLNLCTVDYLVVGDVVPDEEGGILDSYDGNLTVVENVQGGSYGKIKNLEFLKGSLAIQGGRIGDFDGSKLTCKENSGTVTISGGMVCNATVGDGAAVTVTGGTGHAGTWYNDGMLKITDGTFGNVRFRNNGGTIAISGGTFGTITNINGSSSIPLMPLLADNYAFYQGDNAQNSTEKTLTNVTVRPHTHSFENGKCDCGASYVASVTTSNGVTNNYTSLDDALDAAKDGDTVKLLGDAEITKWRSLTAAITLDLNGKTITTQSNAELYIYAQVIVQDNSTGKNGGMAGTYLLNVQEKGDLIIQSGTFDGKITINDGKLTIEGGIFKQEVDLRGGDSDSVFFSGGTFTTLFYPKSSGSFLDLLADGYAFFYTKDSNLVNAAEISGTFLYNVQVQQHTHSFTDGACACGCTCPHTLVDANGVCEICNKRFAASVTAGEDVTYYDTFGSALSYATQNDGCTLKLLADVTGPTVMINNPFIFDLNGHSVDALSVDAKATIKDSGTTKGRIGKVTVSNEKVTDLTLGGLLEEGYAFKYENGYWANDSHMETSQGLSVTVEEAPIKRVVLDAIVADNKKVSTTMAYGTTGAVTLEASCWINDMTVPTYTWYKLEGAAATAPMEGVNGVKYKLPADLPAGKHTYLVICTSGGYSKSAEITITVTPISLEGAEVTVSNLTYNGNLQEPTVTVKLGDETLSRDNDYTVQVTKQTNAGSYKLTIKGGGNYSGEIKDVEWKIEPMKIDSVMVSSGISKTYDGTATVTKTAEEWAKVLTFKTLSASGVVVVDVPSEAYTISYAYFVEKSGEETIHSPDAGEKYGITFKITLNDDNYVLQTYGEDTPSTSKVITQSGGATFAIAQADAPTNIRNGALNVINGTKLKYTYDAKQLLPDAPKGTYGNVSYNCRFPVNLENGYYVDDIAIKDSVLTLTIAALNGGEPGKIGTIPIYITTDNYESFDLPLDLYAVDKITPVVDGDITASNITYSDELSKSTISGKMKDPTTGDEVKGTFAWTDGTIKPAASDNYEAEWTFTPAAGYEEYAPATGTVTIKVNKATPTFTAPTAQENLTYTGQEQALITAGMTDHGTMQYSLTENGTYSQDIPTGTDAGAYTVWYQVIGDENHNDTAPASVAVRIGQKPLTITGVTAASKLYDGTKNAGITSVTFDNVTLTRDTDYTVTASFDDAGVGSGKNVTATVTLMGQTAKNYFLEQSSFPTTGSIIKAAAPGSGLSPAVTVINDLAKTYEMVLSNDYLPKLSSPCEYGNVSYSLRGTYLTDGYKDTVQVKVMEENGQYKLKLTVPAVDYNKVSSVGTIDVRVTSDNYRDFYLTIGVKTKNKDVPVPDGTISASDITYGQALNDSKIAGKMKAGGKAIDGTFTWTNGTFKPAAGDYPASWTFTPAKGYEEYATATGTATVTVDPKAVTVSITPNGGSYGETITPATATANDVVGEDAPKITLTYTGTANDGTKYNGTTPPTKAGTYTIKASTTNANYTLVANTATATFTVAKRGATVTPDNKSKVYQEKDPDLTYKVDGVLDGETLKGITLTRAEGENAGEYDITGTADAGANPNYEVTFAEGKFTINPKSIDGATVKLGKALTANGAEQTQTVEKVLLNDKELPADSYTVAGNTATDPGSHTLTITAKGNYTGTVEQTYVIIPAKAEDAPGEEIAIGSGEVKVVVKSEGTVPPATLLTNKAELLAMLVDSGDISADELAQIADGASVDIALTVKEANVSAEIKTAMAQAAKDCTIGQYLDISLFKYMTVNGKQQDGVALHTTKNALTISVVVPDALINTNSAVNRTYCIVRNHEGTITVLDAAFDAASKTLTFKTDRFSDYAIAYKDTAVPSSGSNPGSNNSSNGSETKKNEVAAPTPAPTPASTSKPSTITAMPQTGDTSNPTLYVVLLVASLLGLAVVFVCKKRNDK